MKENITILAAPSILGLKRTGVEKLPECLLSLGLDEKLRASKPVIHLHTRNDAYRDERPPGKLLNEKQLEAFSLDLYAKTKKVLQASRFPLIVGGDCSILIGVMAALKTQGTYGLIFLDAHADFYLPEESLTGEAADTELALVTGRGSTMLNNLHGLRPYVNDNHVFHIGQRDEEEAKEHGSHRIQDTAIHCFGYHQFQEEGLIPLTEVIVHQAQSLPIEGYWMHFDTDVLSDDENPAVDYRLPGGFTFEETTFLLQKLLRSLPVAGITVTIFNPLLDGEGTIAPRLVKCLENALVAP